MSQKIPKIIHYAWFGGAKKSDLILKCIESWQFYCSDWEIREWNESNFDVNCSDFVFEAYAQKKYAFVSDYVRALALHDIGGVWLDTDVEIFSTLTPMLEHDAFSGFERVGFPFTAVWGSTPKHVWPRKVLESYSNIHFDKLHSTNTISVSQLLVDEFDINRYKDELQFGKDGIVIYPSYVFCLPLPKKIATHHFNASWKEARENHSYGEWLYKYFLRSEVVKNDVSILSIIFYKLPLINLLVSKFHFWRVNLKYLLQRFL